MYAIVAEFEVADQRMSETNYADDLYQARLTAILFISNGALRVAIEPDASEKV